MPHTNIVFREITKEIPRDKFERLATRLGANHRYRKLKSWDHLMAMLYAQMSGRQSLRDLVTSFNTHVNHFYHMGCGHALQRSTLSDANANRNFSIFEGVFKDLLGVLNTKSQREMKLVTEAIDATVIGLNEKKFGWARKPGMKLHMVYDVDQEVPIYFSITHARKNDIEFAKEDLQILSGRTYVIDKGYHDFGFWKEIDNANSFFVTRLKKSNCYEVMDEQKSKKVHIKADQCIKLSNERVSAGSGRKKTNPYTSCLRRVVVDVEGWDNDLDLVTNDFERSAEEIAELYKKRWQIELFFKWIKQNLKIKKYLGRSINAVKIQIFTALIVYLLMHIHKKRHSLSQSLQGIFRVLQTNLMCAKRLQEVFHPPPKKRQTTSPQLFLEGVSENYMF